MRVRLIAAVDGVTIEHVYLEQFPVLIGRRTDCKLRITSRSVSRHHCVLSDRAGWLAARDLDSLGGTFINGQKITAETIIQPGDVLVVGPVQFQVDYRSPSQTGEPEQAGLAASETIPACIDTSGEPLRAQPLPESDTSLPGLESHDQPVNGHGPAPEPADPLPTSPERERR